MKNLILLFVSVFLFGTTSIAADGLRLSLLDGRGQLELGVAQYEDDWWWIGSKTLVAMTDENTIELSYEAERTTPVCSQTEKSLSCVVPIEAILPSCLFYKKCNEQPPQTVSKLQISFELKFMTPHRHRIKSFVGSIKYEGDETEFPLTIGNLEYYQRTADF